MTEGQYRSLVAYLNFWTPQYPWMNLDTAIRDIGITDERQEVICHLSSCLWDFDTVTREEFAKILLYSNPAMGEKTHCDVVPESHKWVREAAIKALFGETAETVS